MFSPYQFKSAYGKALDFEDPRTAYMTGGITKGGIKILAPAIEGLFSPAEKAALNLQQKKGTGQAFINAVKKGEGVKEDELIATGFIDEFKDKKNVELEEVQNFLANNRLDLRKEISDEYRDYSLSQPNEMEDIYVGLPENKKDQEYFVNVFYFPEDKAYSKARPKHGHFKEGAMGHTRVSILPESETRTPVYIVDEVQSDLYQEMRTEKLVSKEKAKELKDINKKLPEGVRKELTLSNYESELLTSLDGFLESPDAATQISYLEHLLYQTEDVKY